MTTIIKTLCKFGIITGLIITGAYIALLIEVTVDFTLITGAFLGVFLAIVSYICYRSYSKTLEEKN